MGYGISLGAPNLLVVPACNHRVLGTLVSLSDCYSPCSAIVSGCISYKAKKSPSLFASFFFPPSFLQEAFYLRALSGKTEMMLGGACFLGLM